MSDTIGGRPERTTGRSAELSERGRIRTAGERTQGASPPDRRKAGLLPIILVATNARYVCGHVRIQAHGPRRTFAFGNAWPLLRHKILPHQVSEPDGATASCAQQQCHPSFLILTLGSEAVWRGCGERARSRVRPRARFPQNFQTASGPRVMNDQGGRCLLHLLGCGQQPLLVHHSTAGARAEIKHATMEEDPR